MKKVLLITLISLLFVFNILANDHSNESIRFMQSGGIVNDCFITGEFGLSKYSEGIDIDARTRSEDASLIVNAVEVSDSQVDITWEHAINGWFRYDADDKVYGGLGVVTGDYNFTWAIKVMPEILMDLGTVFITKVDVAQSETIGYVGDNLTEVRILSGEYGETVLYTQDVTGQLDLTGWTTIDLDQAVGFDNTAPLWIAMYAERPDDTYNEPISNAIDYRSGLMDLYSYNGSAWTSIEENYAAQISWMLRAYVTTQTGKELAIGNVDLSKGSYNNYPVSSLGVSELKPISANESFSKKTHSENKHLSSKGENDLLGYNVYRIKCDNSNEREFLGYVIGTQFSDNTWGTLEWGEYKWYVEEVYSDNQITEGGFSQECIEKDMNIIVNLDVSTCSGDSPVGTIVVFTNTFEEIDDITVSIPASGLYTIDPFRRGTYDIAIFNSEFISINFVDVILDEETTFDWMLEEDLTIPFDFYVTPTGLATWMPNEFVPFVETFDDESSMNNWEVINGGSSSNSWYRTNDFDGNTLDGTPFVYVNSDISGSGSISDEMLISPIVIADGTAQLFLEFDQYYNADNSDDSKVEVYNGTEWVIVYTISEDIGLFDDPDHVMLDISEYANAEFRVRFHYVSGWDFWWAVDNVSIHNGAGKSTEELDGFTLYHNGVNTGFTEGLEYQYGLAAGEALVPGESYLAEIEANYMSCTSQKAMYTWTYLPCSSYPGYSQMNAENIEGTQDVLVNWSSTLSGNGKVIDKYQTPRGENEKTDAIVFGTNIYRDGELIAFVPVADTFYSDLGLVPAFYDYCITTVYTMDEGLHVWESCEGENCIEDVIVSEGCMAPYNLIVQESILENYTTYLNWQTVEPQSQWMYYDTDEFRYSGMSAESSDYSLTWAIKFTPDDLIDYSPGFIAKVSVFQVASVGDYLTEARVMSGDGTNILYAQDVTGTLVEGWNEIVLDNAVAFDNTEDLWIGMYVERPGNTANEPTSDASLPLSNRSDFFAYNNDPWSTIESDYGVENQAFMLRAFVTNFSGKSSSFGYSSTNSYTDYTSVDEPNMHMVPAEAYYVGEKFDFGNTSKSFLGYNIYRNDILIENNWPETEYNDNTTPAGIYCYEVTANYSVCGESEPSNEACLDFGTIVSINPISQEVSPGDVFSTDINIQQVSDLGAFELSLSFDPDYLQANELILGSFLGSSGRPIFPLASNIDNELGLIEYSVTTLGNSPAGPDGDGILLQIVWQATEELEMQTTTNLAIESAQFTHPEGTTISVGFESASVTINTCYVNDFDCDCDVDIIDVTAAAFTYGSILGDGVYEPEYDMDDDGDIDILDITTITYDYGYECSKESLKKIRLSNQLNEYAQLSLNYNEEDLPGEYVVILNIDNINQLGAYEFQLQFDQQKIEIIDISSGGGLESTSRQVLNLINNSDNGLLSFAITTLGSKNSGLNGAASLLKIKYQKNGIEASDFKVIRGQLARIDGQNIPFKLLQDEAEEHNGIQKVYPNPFRISAHIDFFLTTESNVKFSLYNVFGERMFDLKKTFHQKGLHSLTFEHGDLKSGTYFLKMEQNGIIIDVKSIVVI